MNIILYIFLVLTTIVSSSVFPANHGLYAPLESDQCHGKTYQQCTLVPRHEEFDDCVDIIDTIYVDECEHFVDTDCEEEYSHVHIHVDYSYILTQATYRPKCADKRYKECHRVPREDLHTECKTVVKAIYVEHCQDDSILRGCITVSAPYK